MLNKDAVVGRTPNADGVSRKLAYSDSKAKENSKERNYAAKPMGNTREEESGTTGKNTKKRMTVEIAKPTDIQAMILKHAKAKPTNKLSLDTFTISGGPDTWEYGGCNALGEGFEVAVSMGAEG